MSFMLQRLGGVQGRLCSLKTVFLGEGFSLEKVKRLMLSDVKFYVGPTKAGRKKLKWFP